MSGRTKDGSLQRMGAAAKATAWWWLKEPENSAVWPDLHKALDLLEVAGVDFSYSGHVDLVLSVGRLYEQEAARATDEACSGSG